MEQKFVQYCKEYAKGNNGRLPDYIFRQIRSELNIAEEEAVDTLFIADIFVSEGNGFLLKKLNDIAKN